MEKRLILEKCWDCKSCAQLLQGLLFDEISARPFAEKKKPKPKYWTFNHLFYTRIIEYLIRNFEVSGPPTHKPSPKVEHIEIFFAKKKKENAILA